MCLDLRRRTEAEQKASAPSGSIALLMSAKPKLMAASRMLAKHETNLVRPPTVLEVFDRLIRSWRTHDHSAQPRRTRQHLPGRASAAITVAAPC